MAKKIRLIAFEIGDIGMEEKSKSPTVDDLFKRFDGLTFDSKEQYVFNREEATDYE